MTLLKARTVKVRTRKFLCPISWCLLHLSESIVLTMLLIGLFFSSCFADEPPKNLWMGLVAEDTSGNLNTYHIIASVVRNRLKKGFNHGLVALKRKDLTDFVAENYLYVLRTKGIDLEKRAKQAIKEVFIEGKDFAYGATNYEHTKQYPIPYWAKDKKVIKVFYPNTKKELTLWR